VLFAILFSACSLTEQEIPRPWMAWEYRTGENSYVAFTARHIYLVWYSSDNRGAGVSPNLECSGTYSYSEGNLEINYYSGEIKRYDVTDLGNGQFEMRAGNEVEIWVRTKLNDYIHG